MKIAIFSWESRYAVEIGGVGLYVSGLAGALAQAGHEVHIFTRQGAGQPLNDFIFGVYYHRCPCDRAESFFDEVAGFGKSLLYYFSNTAREIGGFDLLHCNDWLTFEAGRAVREEFPEIRMAVTFHTTEWSRSGEWPSSDAAKRIAQIEQKAVDGADCVIAVSREIRRQIELLYQCPDWKMRIVYHGADTVNFDQQSEYCDSMRSELGLTPEQPVVLFAGSLELRKGPDLLMEAIPAALCDCNEARFVFAGEGSLINRLKGTAQSEGIEHAVIFTGVPSQEKMARLFCACDVVCVPFRYDPFGIVTLSAWAAGKPVVVCGEGTSGDFLYNEVNAFSSAVDAAELSRKLVGLLQDDDLRRWMGRNGRVAVETAFSWESVAKQTLQAYQAKEMVQP